MRKALASAPSAWKTPARRDPAVRPGRCGAGRRSGLNFLFAVERAEIAIQAGRPARYHGHRLRRGPGRRHHPRRPAGRNTPRRHPGRPLQADNHRRRRPRHPGRPDPARSPRIIAARPGRRRPVPVRRRGHTTKSPGPRHRTLRRHPDGNPDRHRRRRHARRPAGPSADDITHRLLRHCGDPGLRGDPAGPKLRSVPAIACGFGGLVCFVARLVGAFNHWHLPVFH
jgi:hypothetical protein